MEAKKKERTEDEAEANLETEKNTGNEMRGLKQIHTHTHTHTTPYKYTYTPFVVSEFLLDG